MSLISLELDTDVRSLAGRTFRTGIGTFAVDQAWHATSYAGVGMMVTIDGFRPQIKQRSALGLQYGETLWEILPPAVPDAT